MGSHFLFSDGSIIEGVARLWDFGDSLTEFNRALTPEQADFFAMMADWYPIGDDFRAAFREYPGTEEGSRRLAAAK